MKLKEIIHKCIKGNRKAQRLLYDECHKTVMGICVRYCNNREEAEDNFQEAFVKIFAQLEQLNNHDAFYGWLRQLTIRTCISYYRSQKLFNEPINGHEHIENNSYESVFSKLQTEEILKVINQLPEGYRMVFNLYEVEGYKHAEIAELLNISVGASKSQLSKAKALLCKKLSVESQYKSKVVLDGK